MFLTTLAPGRPRGRELTRAVECPQSLSPLLQAQNIASPKLPLTTYVLGLPDMAACAALLHGPLQLQIWAPFPLPASLFHNTVARQSATHSSHTVLFPFHFLSPLKDHLPPSGFLVLIPDFSSTLRCCPPSFAFALTSASGLASP
jgi:hypothetical protein